MDKENVICIYTHTHTYIHKMEYYSALKKNEILPFATTRMDLECIMLRNKSGLPWQSSHIEKSLKSKHALKCIVVELTKSVENSQSPKKKKKKIWHRMGNRIKKPSCTGKKINTRKLNQC